MIFNKELEVCMEIKDDVIRYVELKSIEPIVVKKYGEKIIPTGLIEGGRIVNLEGFKDFLGECIQEWKIKRRKIWFIEPDETVAIKVVTVPEDILEEEMRGYLFQELGESIILPFDDPAIDYVTLSKVKQEATLADHYFESDSKTDELPQWVQKVLVVATPDPLISEYSEAFTSQQLKPEAADISPLCYYRLYLDQIESEYLPHEIMMLQVDTNHATISIFEDNVPIFMQYEKLFTEKKEWTDHIEMATDMQERFKTLLGDIERILHFYQFSISNGKKISEIIIVGENPYLDYLISDMETELDIGIKTIPETVKNVNGQIVPKKYHLAIGLGLKGVEYYVSRY